jgi:N-methylhydantoinase A
MEQEAVQELTAEGFPPERTRIRRYADLRYEGQSFELTVPMPHRAIDARGVARLSGDFSDEHERTYGHRANDDEPIELVNLRLVAQGVPEYPRLPGQLRLHQPPRGPRAGRRAYFGPERGWRDVPVVDRGEVMHRRAGPCIIEEYDATCVVPPGAQVGVDEHGNLILDLENQR